MPRMLQKRRQITSDAEYREYMQLLLTFCMSIASFMKETIESQCMKEAIDMQKVSNNCSYIRILHADVLTILTHPISLFSFSITNAAPYVQQAVQHPGHANKSTRLAQHALAGPTRASAETCTLEDIWASPLGNSASAHSFERVGSHL
jgi:hypothetical protein